MAIIEKDGFMFYDGLSSDTLVIDSNRINEYVAYINQENIKSIGINDFHYKKSTIEFLKKCPNIEKVSINNTLVEDYSGLYCLKNLRVLYLDEPKKNIDMTHFKILEELAIDYNKFVLGLTSCINLKNLRLWKYKPKSGNLEEISNLINIEELVLTQCSITSLKGCGNLPNLKKLELNYINKLEIIDEIEKNSNTLKHLRFDTCKKIKNHEYVTKLKELELLAFDNCGEIQSIGFIRELPKLKSFIFVKTTIVDGDLSPCLGLEYVGFFDKKHYSHKRKDFGKN